MLKKKYHNLIASTYKDRIVAYDRDQLLQTYPTLQEHLRSEGYELHFCQSLLDLRVVYELNVRNTNGRRLLVLSEPTLPLPDILKDTHYAEAGLSDLFPKLDTDVLKGLSYRELNEIHELPNFDTKSRSATIKFILERIYSIDYDSLIKSDAIEHWLAAILNLYDHNTTLNEAFLSFFKKAIAPIDKTISELVSSKLDLTNFLQKEWQLYVQQDESRIDFSYNLLLKELNQLFIRGELEPVEVSQANEADFQYAIGVYVDKQASLKKSIISLKEEITKELNSNLETVYDWLNFFPLVSRLKYFALKISEDEISEQVIEFEKRINDRFQDFVDIHYNSLFTLSGRKHPATVTRILDYISGVKAEKKALIVVDGLNLWQWDLLREKIGIGQGTYRVSLAWIPTITAWSRQAIFKGEKPDLSSSNRNEEKLFKHYWKNKAVQEHQIAYHRFGSNQEILNKIDYSKKVLGLITNDIDDLMHGTKMGNEQFFIDTEHWAENGGLDKLIERLKAENFKVWITSDHGNVEAVGNGNLPRKTSKFIQSKGKRHIYFDNDDLKKAFLDQGENEYNFAEINNSLYLKDESAFALEGEKLVTHGGSHFWEVAVPFVEI